MSLLGIMEHHMNGNGFYRARDGHSIAVSAHTKRERNKKIK